jgi:16S rRNA (guanine527-N7)-methyltransferase
MKRAIPQSSALEDLATLENGIATLGLQLPEGAAARLMAYCDLLLKWNRTYNLTALKTPGEIITHHLLDALSILPWLDRCLPQASPAPEILDVGSGAGLPGIPLALARPHLRVTLIDAIQKKTAFQQQAAIELQSTNLVPRHGRVESCPAREGNYAVIVSRAFSDLGTFIAATRHLLAPGGTWLAMKGRYPETECSGLSGKARVRDVIPLKVPGLPAERHLLILNDS